MKDGNHQIWSPSDPVRLITQKQHAKGLANTAYDLIHVGGWALIVAGALLIMGLIRYSVAARA